MHHSTARFVLCLIVLVTIVSPSAQPTRAAESLSAALIRQGASIQTDPTTGRAEFITFSDPERAPRADTTAADPVVVARAFLASYGSLFGASIARDVSTDTLQTKRVTANPVGSHAVRFQQTYAKIPVFGAELIVNLDNRNRVSSVNGELLDELAVDTTPEITESVATATAADFVARQYERPRDMLQTRSAGLWLSHPQILGGPGMPVTTLNWRLTVSDGGRIRAVVLVDAHTGAITLYFNQNAEALSQRVCDGTNTPDTDYNQQTDCATDSQAARLNQATPIGNTEVDTAWDNAKATYDFFHTVLGRDSIDDAGMTIISLVNYCPDTSDCPYQNAFWDGVQMTYGATFASADDVVGHELTHGVTEKTAELFYYYQSGAINESLSDVFGELIDQSFTGPGGDATPWLMGEDLPIGAIRSMETPGLYGDPDKMTSTKYHTGLYLGQGDDQGGVHSNSGVNNKAAFLLAAGGTFNGLSVSAIGNTKTAKLYYRVLTQYLTSASDYADLGAALTAACAVLRTDGSGFSADDCTAVKNAVLATEMATTPPRAPAVDAAGCTPSETAVAVYSESFEPVNQARWTRAPAGENDWYLPAPAGYRYATSGRNAVALLGPAGEVDQRLTMTSGFYVAPGTVFSFRHAYEFEAYYSNTGVMTSAYDGALVEYSIDGGTTWLDAQRLFTTNGYNATLTSSKNTSVLAGRAAFSGYSRGYITSTLALDPLAGRNVRFRFRAATDRFVAFMGWFIDDISAYRCVTSAQALERTASGANHTCAQTYSGSVWCWGNNTSGQLGNQLTTSASTAQQVKTLDGTVLRDVTHISVGANHSCAIRSGGVVCWGANTAGQLGDGTTTRRSSAVTVRHADSSSLAGQRLVAVGDAHSCALANDGTVRCWGANTRGELGDGTHRTSRAPVSVQKETGAPLTGVIALSAGSAHTCAVLSGGNVWCWGNASNGATGSPRPADNGAVQVKTATGVLAGITQIAAGAQYTCAIAGQNGVWCWGNNSTGQLGDGTTTQRAVAVPVRSGATTLKNATAIAVSRGSHSCVVLVTGGIMCWGANQDGQLGDGTMVQRTSAVAVKSTTATTIGPVREIVTGIAHTCARTSGGAVWCWGRNTSGQLGISKTSVRESATRSRNALGLFGE